MTCTFCFYIMYFCNLNISFVINYTFGIEDKKDGNKDFMEMGTKSISNWNTCTAASPCEHI